MGTLDDRVVLVTGGGRGIGREHCRLLAREGAAVVVNDPGVSVNGETTAEDPADSVVREITEAGGRAVADKGSVTEWKDAEAMVARAVDTYGRLDGVVNNAGILRDRMITSLSEDDFESVIRVHLMGTFAVTKHACDHWRRLAKAGQPSAGRIVNTTSSSGLTGNIGQAPYASAKAGIVGLTLVTAKEMDRYGVTCNAVSPVAMTRMTNDLKHHADDGLPTDDAFHPLHPGSASPVVAYLVSEQAAWISGQVFRIEGDTVILMEGWRKSESRFSSATDEFLRPGDLAVGMRQIFGSFPATFRTPVK